MAYGTITNTNSNRSWISEQTELLNALSDRELESMKDKFDKDLEKAQAVLESTYECDVRRDYKRMLENKEIMKEYKQQFLAPLLEDLRNTEAPTEAEKMHMEQVADQLDEAWDAGVKAFVTESYNVSNYLPLSTLDFPALVKQYIKFLGKEIIPVQTASSFNIEQRILIKYLVNNQTGEEYEVPKVYFQREPDGTRTWKKLFNAGKGYRINDKKVLLLSAIAAAPQKKFSVFTWLLDDNGNELDITAQKTVRTRLSYDFHVNFVQLKGSDAKTNYNELSAAPADWGVEGGESQTYPYTSKKYFKNTGTAEAPVYTGIQFSKADSVVSPSWATATAEGAKVYEKVETPATQGKKVRLPGNGINIDIQTGGVFLNGGITSDMKLPVVNPTTNIPTGETVSFDDRLSGVVDFIRGTVTASSCGEIEGIYISGYVSNETNMRTIGYREHPLIRKFTIADGCRFQLPFTVEDFAEAQASLTFNLYNRMTQELVTHQELFEDESILEFLDKDFDENSGYEADIWSQESFTHTEYADIDPCSISDHYAGNPFAYRTDAIQNAIASVIYELCDRAKMDNLGFVIYANPKVARLLSTFTTWTVQKNTNLGGVQMNYSFGVMTDFETPIRVVSSNRVDAYTLIDAYQEDTQEGDKSREYVFKIVAYPMDKFHVTYKHLRFARHLTNSPENAAYADAQNPGGQAVLITTSSQYETIVIQGIQGRVILKNSYLVPDSFCGLVDASALITDGENADGTDGG